MTGGGGQAGERKQIYTHEAQWPLYAINFSNRQEKNFRLALGSYSEDLQNQVEIIKLDEDKGDFEHCTYFEHEYPPTKIMWIPDQVRRKPMILLSSFLERNPPRFDSYLRRIPQNLASRR
jgi:DDB1- and CUL4-associated factor 7